MPLYRYSGSSLIDEVRFLSNENGGIRAYLHASPQAKSEQLAATLADLNKLGYITVPCRLNGQEVLEVRGFKKENHLRTALAESGAVQGHPFRDELGDDKLDVRAWFKQKSLMISAILYLVGDFCFIAYQWVHNQKVKPQLEKDKINTLNNKIRAWNKENKDDTRSEIAEPDTTKPKTFAQRFWGTMSGYGYLAGSSASLASLFMRADTAQIELGDISRFLAEESEKAGLKMEEESPLQRATLLHDARNPFAKKFTTYAPEMMNLSFAAAGVGIALDNIEDYRSLKADEKAFGYLGIAKDKRHREKKQVAVLDTILGAGTFLSGVTSSVIKEKPHDPNKPHKKGLAGAIEYMKERPLRIAGGGYLVATVIHLVSSLKERSSINAENKRMGTDMPTYHTTFRLLFVIMNLVAEVVMFFSSKGHGEGLKSDESLDTTAAAMVAQMIAKKPKEQHEALIETMSEVLSQPHALGIKVEKAEELLREQLENLEKNPWAKEVKNETPPKSKIDLPQELLTQPVEERLDVAAPAPSVSTHGVTPRDKIPLLQTSLLNRVAAGMNDAGVNAAVPL